MRIFAGITNVKRLFYYFESIDDVNVSELLLQVLKIGQGSTGQPS